MGRYDTDSIALVLMDVGKVRGLYFCFESSVVYLLLTETRHMASRATQKGNVAEKVQLGLRVITVISGSRTVELYSMEGVNKIT